MLAAFCEDVREKLLKRLGEGDAWRSPVAVVVRHRSPHGLVPMPGEEAPLRSSVVSVSGYLRFQIDIEPPPPVDAGRFVHTLVSVLCTEMANRKTPKVQGGQKLARAPLWLVQGLAAGLDADARARSLAALKEAFARGSVPDFTRLTESETSAGAGVDVSLHQAACEILVGALESQPDGRSKLRKFLFGLRAGEPWQAAMGDAFGQSFDLRVVPPKVLEKWWTLTVCRAVTLIVPQARTALDTRHQLETTLQMSEGSTSQSLLSGKLDPEVAKRYLKKPRDLLALLLTAEAQLHTLGTLAHPLYRPVIGRYLQAIDWLRKGKLRQFEKLLAEAAAARLQADQKTNAISSYVGSLEASLFPEDMVERFGDWFQAARPGETATPVGDYLDRVESGMK